MIKFSSFKGFKFNNLEQNKSILFALQENNGYVGSIYSERSIDENGYPLPWLNYPTINFIKDRFHLIDNIFEYGCGYSTLFYANYGKGVNFVEHNETWFNKINTSLLESDNSKVSGILKNGSNYSMAIADFNKKYDLIVVDGKDRFDCIKGSINYLLEGGLILLDNSERESYAEIKDFMREIGFKRIDFKGLSPMSLNVKYSSVFYKNDKMIGL